MNARVEWSDDVDDQSEDAEQEHGGLGRELSELAHRYQNVPCPGCFDTFNETKLNYLRCKSCGTIFDFDGLALPEPPPAPRRKRKRKKKGSGQIAGRITIGRGLRLFGATKQRTADASPVSHAVRHAVNSEYAEDNDNGVSRREPDRTADPGDKPLFERGRGGGRWNQ